MYEELFKDLLKVKLKMAEAAITILPPKYREKTLKLERCIIKAISDVTNEYLENKPAEKEDKRGIKEISIE